MPNDFVKYKLGVEMGGFGSGRQHGANCTDDYRQIDIRRWQREKLLKPGRSFSTTWSNNGEQVAAISVKVEVGQLRLIYNYRRNEDQWENLNYAVGLQTTTNHYGGIRYWFTCPEVECGRRVAVLYLGGKIFACRHCYQLHYRSQRETKSNRAYRGADKVRAKLTWEPGIFNPPEDKPKGMHWNTYCRLLTKHKDYSYAAYAGMLATFKKIDSKIADLQLAE